MILNIKKLKIIFLIKKKLIKKLIIKIIKFFLYK